jgi:hypothetical protein
MVRKGLIVLFALILVLMLLQTARASMVEALWEIPSNVTGNPWFIATLMDAYFGFLVVYLWVFYREQSGIARVAWFVLLMLLGNIAIAVYCLRLLFTAPPNVSLGDWMFALARASAR